MSRTFKDKMRVQTSLAGPKPGERFCGCDGCKKWRRRYGRRLLRENASLSDLANEPREVPAESES